MAPPRWPKPLFSPAQARKTGATGAGQTKFLARGARLQTLTSTKVAVDDCSQPNSPAFAVLRAHEECNGHRDRSVETADRPACRTGGRRPEMTGAEASNRGAFTQRVPDWRSSRPFNMHVAQASGSSLRATERPPTAIRSVGARSGQGSA